MRILVTSPETDDITRYLRAWTKQSLEKAHHQHQVFHLDREKVTRKHFCGILRKKSINVVCLNGHGADDRILGHRQETLLDTQNIELLSGTTAHVLACNTAKTLGPSAMAVGTRGYIGYDERFIMLSRPTKISQPLQDDVARLFLDAAFTAPKALLDGKSCQEAVELTQNESQTPQILPIKAIFAREPGGGNVALAPHALRGELCSLSESVTRLARV